MNRLLMVLLIVAACIVGFGFYRGWFGVATDGSGSQHRITFSVDQDKIEADKKRAQDQLPAMGQATTPAEPKKD